MNRRYTGEGALLVNTLIWGGTFVIIKSALEDISPMLFISLRFTLAALLFLPFVFKSIRTINKGLLWGGILLGLLYFLGFAAQTAGLNYTTATKSGFITGSFVIFTPMFQMLIEKKKPGKGSVIGIILVLSGLVLLSSKGESITDVFTELGSNFNAGDFLTLLCAVFFSLYLVYLDIISKKYDYKPLVFLQIAVTGIGGLLFALIFSASGIEEPKLLLNFNVIFAVLYTSILATIITTSLQTKYQKVVTPTKAGIILSFEPIFAAGAAYFVLSEGVSNFGFIGCILIFAGLLASEIIDKGRVNNDK